MADISGRTCGQGNGTRRRWCPCARASVRVAGRATYAERMSHDPAADPRTAPHAAAIPGPSAETSAAPTTAGSTARTAAAEVLEHFRWIDGDADTWTMLRDPVALRTIAAELARLSALDAPDLIVGIEARGFVLAPLVALATGVGFAPIRKRDALFPGDTTALESAPDYRGRTQRLSARRDHLGPGVRVSLVDDWIETGSQAVAAAELIASTGATLVNITVIIDEAGAAAHERLPVIRSVVRGAQLP